jgi:hypothetical protein
LDIEVVDDQGADLRENLGRRCRSFPLSYLILGSARLAGD